MTKEEEYQRTLEAAARQLGYRMLSCKGLRDKLLEKGHAEDAVEYAIAWMQERGILDDSAYAAGLAETYRRRGYGLMRIRQELAKRGVERDTADGALESLEPDLPQMVKLLDKRLCGDLSNRKEVNKAVAALQRRGYVWDDIRRALQEYGASLEEIQDPAEDVENWSC